MGFFSTTELRSTFKKPLSEIHSAYKYVRLENRLKTLLISDPKCNATAAAVCVGAGSHSDPDELPGLAHFCEHMLFMGTEEFPNPNDFWSKMTSMGGNANAYTMGDYTCIYFEVLMTDTLVGEEWGLNYLMKNFSSFFRSPLFLMNSMNMEVKSVDDEHQGNIVNDEKILYHGLRLLSSETHPFHRFATGNKNILNSKRTRKEMIKHYEHNFVSENMVLVLKGPLSLNQLQKLAVSNFANIPPSNDSTEKSSSGRMQKKPKSRGSFDISVSSVSSCDVGSEIFPPATTGRLLYIKSETASKVRLFLPIHDLENSFYEGVWCSLFGDESLGSMCYYLKRVKNYVSSVYVFTQCLSKGNKILVIDLESSKPFNLDSVIHAIWTFVDQILNPRLTDLAAVLHEYSRVFKYQAYFSQEESSSVMEEAANYALSLHENKIRDLEHLVTGDSFIFHGKVDHFVVEIKEVFDIRNLNVIVLSKETDWGWMLPNNLSKDPYYRFQYAIINLNYPYPRESIPNFFILQQNRFIEMSHSELDDQLDASQHTAAYLLEESNLPNLIDFSMYHEIWHSPTLTLNVMTSFQICFASVSNTPLSLVGIEAIAEYVGEKLRSAFYQAELALFSWGIFANLVTTPSLSFEIRGPITGFLFFLKEFVVRVKNLILTFNLDYKAFVAMKLQMRHNYDELQDGETNTKVLAASVMALEQGIASIEDRFEAVELLETDYLAHLCDLIIHDCKHTNILVVGGDKAFAMEVCKLINIMTSHERIYLAKNLFNYVPSVTLRSGRNYNLVLENSNYDDPNDVVYYYIQVSSRQDEKKRTIAQFLAYHMNQFVRYQLRNRRQIGYLVFSGVRINKSTTGVYILVNSASYDYSRILSEIEEVLFEWEIQVLAKTPDQFSELFESFAKSLGSKEPDAIPSNISAATKPTKQSYNYASKESHLAYFESILTKNYDFAQSGGYKPVSKDNTHLELAEIVEFFKRSISIKSAHRATLSILVSSKEGKRKRVFEENKEMLKSMLVNGDYHLTSLQLASLLHESHNDVSIVIQKLRNLGYKISPKHGRSLYKILWMIKSFKVYSSKQQERLQRICIAKYGKIYQDSLGIVPHLKVRKVQEIHAEAYIMDQKEHLRELQGIYDRENEDTDDLNYLI
ncbi:AXL1 [Candida margitis]|uniref:AXL1 n=1 Tax=Candida margitis TaxID=1775924 RepID=UPI002226C5FE|nr:AXL1 [Candida margitis]KAI5970932.1 AXL1 [Candida margitis]